MTGSISVVLDCPSLLFVSGRHADPMRQPGIGVIGKFGNCTLFGRHVNEVFVLVEGCTVEN
jgi:hypothetical protein